MINQNVNNNAVQEQISAVEAPPSAGIVPESLIQIIWRSRWIVLLAMAVVLAAAFVYLSRTTPIYTSTSRVYVEQRGPRILEETEGVMTHSKNYLYTQAELLKSTPIISSALDSISAGKMRTFDRIDNPVAYVKKTMDVLVGKNDDLINVSFDSPQPADWPRRPSPSPQNW